MKAEIASLQAKIKTQGDYALGALMALFGPPGEETAFKAEDAQILTELALWYGQNGYVTERQVHFLQGKLPKYAQQLMAWGGVTPLPVDDGARHRKVAAPAKSAALEIPGLKGELFGFQDEGVQFLERKKGRGMIADEPGLGKTIQALAWLQLHKELRPAVIIVPGSVKLNWQREAESWVENPHTRVLSGKTPNDLLGRSAAYILNYAILANQKETYWVCPQCKKEHLSKGGVVKVLHSQCDKCKFELEVAPHFVKREIRDSGWIDSLCSLKPGLKAVILDECQYLKSAKANRTEAAVRLCKGVPHVIALSGTPIVNRPAEFFTTLKILQPRVWPSYWRYTQRYCGARHSKYGWDFSGATNTQELHDRLVKSVMIRRLKKDVLKDLPEKMRAVVPMELDNRKVYEAAEGDFVGWLRTQDKDKAVKASRAEALARIEGLKQLTIAGKLNGCAAWIQDFLESGEKLVVFCTHQATVDHLAAGFGLDYIPTITGKDSGVSRQFAIDSFQKNEKVPLIVCNIKAGGVGINLQAASNVCFVELEWSPSTHDQAEDRVHRIGQTASSVNAWYLLAADTIEEEIAELLDKKRKVLTQVLDGKDVDEQSLLTELLDKYKEEK